MPCSLRLIDRKAKTIFHTNNKEEYAKIASLLAAETERAAMPCEKKHGNPVRATSADKRQRMGVCIRKRIRMRRGFFAGGSPVDYRKGDPTGTVGTRLCPAKYSVLHRNNAVAQNRSFESPLR